ncbi:MAG: hypothetical protein AAFY06_13810, partial [Pseudomonadota bacterium]
MAEPARRPVLSKPRPRPDGTLLCVVTDKIASAGAAPVVARALADLLEDDVHLLVAASDRDTANGLFPDTAYLAWQPEETTEDVAAFLKYWTPDLLL